ncbi:MAG: hypothetical protein DRP83_07220 [Planctomycetota bacterium]|nr:MAG: hypothetical protein DRP83_07220 [Planctomycetota bacterium]
MKTSTRLGTIIALGFALVVAGCNAKPATPRTKWYKQSIKTLAVDQGNAAEVAAVGKMESARLRYRRNISALQDYYNGIGNIQKALWASRELKNLDEAQEFQWVGLAPASGPATAPAQAREDAASQSQRELVENLIASRKTYILAVDGLAKLYEKAGDDFKAYVIHTTQSRFRPERTYMYLLDVEVPSKNLQPIKVYPAANRLYEEALALYKQGSSVPALANYDKQRRALKLFKQLIKQYPDSTRIALAAFYIAEIYKEYFGEHYLAVLWYERAWTWDPYIAAPVRFQAALQYDIHLDEKEKAMELYKASQKLEPYYENNHRYCKQRIRELQEQGVREKK